MARQSGKKPGTKQLAFSSRACYHSCPMRVYINGEEVEGERAQTSLLSPAFLYGYGVFETLRTYHTHLFALERHLSRLFRSAEEIELTIPYTRDMVAALLTQAIKGVTTEQRVKVILIPGQVIVCTETLEVPKNIDGGVRCVSVQRERSLPELKTLAYLDSYLPHREAERQGAYDAILVDRDGYVTEAAYANVWWVDNSTLYTRNDHILPGITREIVLQLSPVQVIFDRVTPTQLCRADEVFLTQTTTGVVSVIQMNEKKIGDGLPGGRTREVQQLFDQYVNTQCIQ